MPSARRPPSRRRAARPAPQRPYGLDGSDRPPATRRSVKQRRGRGGGGAGGGSDLAARILVAIPAAFVAWLFVTVGGTAFAVFMIVLGWACLHELYRLLARWRPVTLVGFAALAGLVLAGRFGNQREVLEVAVATVPVLFLVVVARGHGGATVAIAGTLLGVYWIGLAFAHAALLRQSPHGGGVLIDVLVGTFLGDTGAYIGGQWFGRRPLAPNISPRKTVEGLFCGMLTAVVAVVAAGSFQVWLTRGDALLLGATVAVLGPIGDLFESVVKRDAGIKDAGHVFGAHGGALDRLDAVLFTVVAGYYVWTAVMT